MIGFIGGSGLYDVQGLADARRERICTPFGDPSDEVVIGRMEGRDVCFLPRHGKGHRIMPSEINHRANIFAFKTLGVRWVISISAVGSLKESLRPGDICLPDQYFDRTKDGRGHTFFGGGVVAHISFATPGCVCLRETLFDAIRAEEESSRGGVSVQVGGTYVNMEGPAFSTKAESNVYRSMGFDVIGMTSLPEAKLCREAEICYQAMTMVTDYDCWHAEEAPVTVQAIIARLMANTEFARRTMGRIVRGIQSERRCGCQNALEHAIITDRGAIPEERRLALQPIIGKYLAG